MSNSSTNNTILHGRRQRWVSYLRESEVFGRGSCTRVDEAMTDEELLQEIIDCNYLSYEECFADLIDIEQVFWEQQGIDWKPSA